MGCNQSKASDIQDASKGSQRTRKIDTNGTKKPLGQRTTVPVGVGPEDKLPNDGEFSRSYHDQREVETDYWKNIIENTASDFIDVSSTIAPLEGNDAAQRVKDYSRQIKQSKVYDVSLYKLPSSSSSNNNPATVLVMNSISPDDKDFMHHCGQSVISAMRQGLVVKNMGPIVVSFPEITT